MLENDELHNLVSSVLNEINYSHCRLCLKGLSADEQYVRYQDRVSLGTDCADFMSLSEIITILVGKELSEEITGIDAVCVDCVNKALEASKFIKQCQRSTALLNKVFSNLTDSFNIQDIPNKNQCLYVVVKEDETRLIFHDKTKKLYTCSVCEVEFDNAVEDKQQHYWLCHDLHVCDRCNDTFANEDEYRIHKNSTTVYKCEECKVSKCTEESLKQHQDITHTVFVCKDCGKSFRGLEKLQNHELKHDNKNTCPKCGKSYSTKEFYLKHVKLCLENMLDPHPMRSKIKKTYFCNECGKGYSTPGGLRVHQRFVHGNAKHHVCKFCNKAFTAPSYLKVHMIKHTGEKNFKCNICSRKFVSKEALLYHTRRHTGEKPYSCNICEEKFVNASARAEHIKFKHVGPTLMCEICPRKFVTPNFLRLHMMKHEDRTNKLYSGRTSIPPNLPRIENVRVHIDSEVE